MTERGAELEPAAWASGTSLALLAEDAAGGTDTNLIAVRRALAWLDLPGVAHSELLRNLVERWLLEYRSWRTRIEYARDLGRASDWLTLNADGLLRATRGQLAAWGEAMRRGTDRPVHPGDDARTRTLKTREASETTIARRYSTVSSFFTYIVQSGDDLQRELRLDQDAEGRRLWGHLRVLLPENNPAANLRRPKTPARTSTARAVWLDADQAAALLLWAKRDSARAYAIVTVMLCTGARTSEILDAHVADAQKYKGRHRVLRVTRKGGVEQDLPLDDLAVDALDDYLGERTDGPLFQTEERTGGRGGGRLDEPYLLRLLRRLARDAGLPEQISRWMHPHALRHTALTLAAQAGATQRQIQLMAGHEDPRTTERYMHGEQNLADSPAYLLGDLLRRRLAPEAPTGLTQPETTPAVPSTTPIRQDEGQHGAGARAGLETSRKVRTPAPSPRAATIHQLRVQLVDVTPAVWRRVLLPSDLPLARAAEAVLTAVGWEGYHLHAWHIGRDEYGGGGGESDWGVALGQVLAEGDQAGLQYDFGDDWHHFITVEKVKPYGPVAHVLPYCSAGQRVAPPEDSGGPLGYHQALAAARGPNGSARREAVEILGHGYDPAAFDRARTNQALAQLAESWARSNAASG